MSLLGVDVGTSGLKVVAHDEATGRAIAGASQQYLADIPFPGGLELDPATVLSAFDDVIRSVTTMDGVRHDPVRALAICVSGDEVALVDGDGRSLAPVILSSDARGDDLLDQVRADVPSALLRRTGLPLSASYPIVRLLWYREHLPELFENTAAARGWDSLLLSHLGLPPVTDETAGSRWMAFDAEDRQWLPEVLVALNLSRDLLPVVSRAGQVVGVLEPCVAQDLGLRAGTVVAAGGFDQSCAAFGAGAFSAGEAVVGTGTWEVLTAVLSTPPAEDGGSALSWGPHLVDRDALLGMAANPAGASALEWASRVLGLPTDHQERESALDRALTHPTGLLVPPHLHGSGARGRASARAAFTGISWSTTAQQMIGGLVEGVTFELRRNIELLRRWTPVDRLRSTGGGSRSARWTQLKADVTGLPVQTVDVEETGCLAAAVLAGSAIGVFHEPAEALESFVHVSATAVPDPRLSAEYDELYLAYLELDSVIGRAGSKA